MQPRLDKLVAVLDPASADRVIRLTEDMRYDGELMEFPIEGPPVADLLGDDPAVAKLAGVLIRNYVDRVKSDRLNGRCRVQFHLEH